MDSSLGIEMPKNRFFSNYISKLNIREEYNSVVFAEDVAFCELLIMTW